MTTNKEDLSNQRRQIRQILRFGPTAAVGVIIETPSNQQHPRGRPSKREIIYFLPLEAVCKNIRVLSVNQADLLEAYGIGNDIAVGVIAEHNAAGRPGSQVIGSKTVPASSASSRPLHIEPQRRRPAQVVDCVGCVGRAYWRSAPPDKDLVTACPRKVWGKGSSISA